MTGKVSVSIARRIVSVFLATIFTLHPAPAVASDPTPQMGDPVSLENSALPDNSLALTGCERVEIGAINASYEQRVVELVNQYRAAAGLPPFKRSADLDYSARYHAKDMMDEDYFTHDSQDRVNNTLVSACTWSTRIQKFYTNRTVLAENIAGGYLTPETVVEGWMKSTTGHRENILSANNDEIGVGFMELGGRLGRYWVQDFGRRAGNYPLIINREAVYTNRMQVSLYIYGQGVWNEMRLHNDSEGWSAWQPFQQSLGWVLPASTGMHTVSVEMRKTGGSTAAASSDTIMVINLPYSTFIPAVSR